MGTGEQADLEFIVIGSHDGEEGGDWRSAGCGLVWRPYIGWVGFLEVGQFGEEDFLMCLLEVQVGGGGRRSKERGVPRELGNAACS